MPLSRLVAATLVALLALACTTVNPVTGRRQVVLMSPEDERRVDAEAAQQIEQQYGLVRDPELAAYVDAVGQALAKHSPRQDVLYSFQIVEMDEPNAFALPGGHIYVSRGLLTITNTEAELANVLGHEIGHVAARHAAQQDAYQKTLGLSSLLSDILSGGSEDLPESEPISGSPIARFARNQEREADRIGQDIAVAAGVDPAGMAQFLYTLDSVGKLRQGFSMPQTYFATHPATAERIAEAASSAHTRSWRTETAPLLARHSNLSIAPTRDDFLDRIEGIAVGRPASEGVFVDDWFLHPDLDFALRFPSGWRTSNQSAQVVAVSPKRDGVVLLQLHGPGDDPEAAAREFAEQEGLNLEDAGPLRVGGLPAYRGEALVPTSFGRVSAAITWIAYEGNVYRLIAGMQPGRFRRYQGIFRKYAHSFRPLTDEDRARITELRLRTVHAREGESLPELSKRTGNSWDLHYTAVVNGLLVGERLIPGERIKIALREPYHVGDRNGEERPPARSAAPAQRFR